MMLSVCGWSIGKVNRSRCIAAEVAGVALAAPISGVWLMTPQLGFRA